MPFCVGYNSMVKNMMVVNIGPQSKVPIWKYSQSKSCAIAKNAPSDVNTSTDIHATHSELAVIPCEHPHRDK